MTAGWWGFEDLLVRRIAEITGVDEQSLDGSIPLAEAGLSSIEAVELSEWLASKTGLDVPPTLIFDYPTIEAITGYLESELEGRGHPSSLAGARGGSE